MIFPDLHLPKNSGPKITPFSSNPKESFNLKYIQAEIFATCRQTIRIIFLSKCRNKDEARSQGMPGQPADEAQKFPAVGLLKTNCFDFAYLVLSIHLHMNLCLCNGFY